MRPHSNGHARRALAAVGALALGVVLVVFVALPQISTAQLASARARQPARHRPPRRRTLEPLSVRATLLSPNVLIGRDVAVVGSASRQLRHRVVVVQEFRAGRWRLVARTVTDRLGHFAERFWARELGTFRLRVRAAGVPVRRTRLRGRFTTIYHQVVASWYDGPGATTACGEALGSTTLGVANRTLPCGTMVTLRLGRRSVRVPVIDRGPFVYGRDYDLTYATKLALGAGDVQTLWANA